MRINIMSMLPEFRGGIIPHRIEKYTREGSIQLRDTYEVVFEPFGDVPLAARQVVDELLEVYQSLRAAYPGTGLCLVPGIVEEVKSFQINFRELDFERRYLCTLLQAHFACTTEGDPKVSSDDVRFYIYDNGVGIYRKVQARSFAPISTEHVVEEHYVTAGDLPALHMIKAPLLR